MARRISSAAELVRAAEGCLLTAKPDAKGKWVIGRGHDIAAPKNPDEPPTCTQDEADHWFDVDLASAVYGAINSIGLGCWSILDEPRRSVLIDMAFEMGQHGLKEFEHMLAAIIARDWKTAHEQALDSQWHRHDAPSRARRDATILLTGEWPFAA